MTFKRVFLAALVAGGMIGSAAAEDYDRPTGWYLSGGGGANFLDRDTIPNIVGGVGNHNIGYDSGWLGVGALGYKLDETLRLEIELGYRDNNMTGVSNTGVGPTLITNSSDTTAFSQMVNAIFDIPLSERVDVSLGGGVGAALVDSTIATLAGGSVLNDSDYGFAYQALAGLTYNLYPRWQAFADYRYFATSGSDLFAVNGTGIELDYDSHSAVVGLRYFLSEQAAPPPPAPVASDIGPWIVFFDFNKSNIRADAANTISTAVAQAQDAETLRFRVTGHTDTVGSASYNDALSLRRAEAVKGELIRLGVPENEIAISGAGFGDPLVSTGPGVREQQNRRAVIEIP